MGTKAMLDLASNPNTPAAQLSPLVNKHVEVNRLLASHPHSTPAMLEEMYSTWCENTEGYDDETRRNLVRNPNLATEFLIYLAQLFPSDFLGNPALDLLLIERPDLFDEIPVLLETPVCPEQIVRSMAENGTRRQQQAILRNPNLPQNIRDKLTPDYFYQQDLKKLNQLASEQEDEDVRKCIEIYANTSRLFCTPNFLPFDPSNPQHRLDDQVFCGFPFTSAKWPWPKEKIGDYMQPIAQINLTNAGQLLECELGEGLLQVWGGINSTKKVELKTRLVPTGDLSDPMDDFYPEKSPWLEDDGSDFMTFDDCAMSGIGLDDFPPFGRDQCRVSWTRMGQMFYPDFDTRVFNPLAGDTIKRKFDYKLTDALEKLQHTLEELQIPASNFLQNVLGKDPLIRLGGYAEKVENAWDQYSFGNMLLFHSLGYAEYSTVGVTFKKVRAGKIKFEANWSCDR